MNTTRIVRSRLTDAELRSLLDEYTVDGETEVVATLRVGNGKDSVRLANYSIVFSRAELIRTMKQFCWLFPYPRLHGGWEIEKERIPDLYRYSRKVYEKAQEAWVKSHPPAKVLLRMKNIPTGSITAHVWFQICAEDIRKTKEAFVELLQTAKIGHDIAIPCHALEWGENIDFLKKNVAKWAEQCGVKVKLRKVRNTVVLRRLS